MVSARTTESVNASTQSTTLDHLRHDLAKQDEDLLQLGARVNENNQKITAANQALNGLTERSEWICRQTTETKELVKRCMAQNARVFARTSSVLTTESTRIARFQLGPGFTLRIGGEHQPLSWMSWSHIGCLFNFRELLLSVARPLPLKAGHDRWLWIWAGESFEKTGGFRVEFWLSSQWLSTDVPHHFGDYFLFALSNPRFLGLGVGIRETRYDTCMKKTNSATSLWEYKGGVRRSTPRGPGNLVDIVLRNGLQSLGISQECLGSEWSST